MKRLLLTLLLAASCWGPLLLAQEYSVLGEIGLMSSYTENPAGGAENSLESLLDIEAEHRIDYEKLSFIARHEVEVNRQEELEHILHEAYLDYRPGEKLRLGAGKQRIAWGRGLAFFPTDALHPSHTDEDVEGFSGLSLLYTPGLNLQLSGALDFTAPLEASGDGGSANEDFYREIKYALYLSYFFGNADLALSAVYRPEKVLRPGVGISYELAGFVLNAEAAAEFYNQLSYPDGGGYTPAEELKPYPLIAAGLSRNFIPAGNPDLSYYLAAEYLFAGSGYDKDEAAVYYADLKAGLAPLPESYQLGRHYLFASGSLELFQSFAAEISGLMNLQDQSAQYNAGFTLLTIPDVDLKAEGTLLTGGSATEFGLAQGSEGDYSISLGARIYF